MKTLYLIPILWIFGPSIKAQVNLKGTVQDSLGKALPFVSVAVLKTDSSLVKATATNEQGEFNFEKIKHRTGSTLRSGSKTLIPDIVRIESSSPIIGETAKPWIIYDLIFNIYDEFVFYYS